MVDDNLRLYYFQVKKSLDPEELFTGDIVESALKTRKSIELIDYFRETFTYFKDNLGKYFVGRRVVQWTIDPKEVFERLDRFYERLKLIRWFFDTVIEFRKLNNIEIGGFKGKMLSEELRDISQEFEIFFQTFAAKCSDVLDPDDKTFSVDFKEFEEGIVTLDMKLATILVESFDNCSTLEDIFKVTCMKFIFSICIDKSLYKIFKQYVLI